MVNDKLKKIIFNKLYEDLSNAEIIQNDGSVWFIDRDTKYWYLELRESGTLFWKYQFFANFFILFSLVRDEYELIIGEWVEDVLNHEVVELNIGFHKNKLIGELLNPKVNEIYSYSRNQIREVTEALNHKVIEMGESSGLFLPMVEKVLTNGVK